MNMKLKTTILSGILALILTVTSVLPTTVSYAAETMTMNTSFDTASELIYNTSIIEHMSGSDTMRYYKFSSDCAISLDISGKISNIMNEITVYIYDANRKQIANYSKSWFPDFEAPNIILTGGDYYLGICYSEDISFKVIATPLEESFPETQTKNNNSLSNANSVEFFEKYNGVIAKNDTEDNYKFTVPVDCKMTIETTSALSDEMEIIIYDDSYGKYYTGVVNPKSSTSDKVQLAGGEYFICFRQKNSGSGRGSYDFNLSYIMNGPTITSYKNKQGKKMSIKWSSIKNVDGYELQYSLNKTFNSDIKKKNYSSKIHNVTINNLVNNKKYYVRIRAYYKVNGIKKYSTWSSVKSIKISD